VLGSDRERRPVAVSAALAVVVGWTYIGSGLVARRQRGENRLGAVMLFIGFAWFATFLADGSSSLVFTLGKALESVYLVGFVYLVLSFPSGRLPGRLDRGLIASAVVLVAGVELAWLLFADSGSQICSGCPHNALEITRNDGLADAILQGQRVVGVALSVFTVVLLVRRWRRASGPERRAGAPVLWAGSAMFAALAFSVGNDILGHPLGEGGAGVDAGGGVRVDPDRGAGGAVAAPARARRRSWPRGRAGPGGDFGQPARCAGQGAW
jgi:hypothetical protein